MRLPPRRARARCVDWERRLAWDRFPPEVAPETRPSSPIQPVFSPDPAGGPRNVESSFRSEPPPARPALSRLHPLLTPFTGYPLTRWPPFPPPACSSPRLRSHPTPPTSASCTSHYH